jgi:hypothetical protein
MLLAAQEHQVGVVGRPARYCSIRLSSTTGVREADGTCEGLTLGERSCRLSSSRRHLFTPHRERERNDDRNAKAEGHAFEHHDAAVLVSSLDCR